MKIFWSFARQAFQFIAAYRFNFFMEFILVLLRMYGIYWVWRVLYTQRPGAFGVDLGQMVTYGVMGMAIELIMEFNVLVQHYPIDIFGLWFRVIVTGIIPVAFMNYYPSLLLLDKYDPNAPYAWMVYMSPVVALVLSLVASRVWNLAIRRYASSGG